MFESKYSKVLTGILIAVIVAIVVLLAFLAFDYIKKYNITKQASDFVENYQGEVSSSDNLVYNDEYTNDIETDVNELLGGLTSGTLEQTPTTNTGTSSGSSQKKKYKGFSVVGTMKIPSINLEYPIIEEVSTKALETALVALYPSGDNLNLVGNTVIVGHNYRNGTFFSNLKKVENGTKIYVTDYRGQSLTYEVYNKFEAEQNDTSFYTRDTNGLAELTLSTCTDASNDQRTIVFAKQI